VPAAPGLGCGSGRVVKAQVEPAQGAIVALDGDEKRQNRWVVDPGPHQIDVTWPDGTRITQIVEVRRDVLLVLTKEGRAGVEGIDQAPPAAATPDPAPATGPEPVAEPTPAEAFARAKELFQAGQKAFELAEFDSAIENFKGAYELLSSAESKEYRSILVQVVYNLAVVYERSYDITPEVERLRRAKVMFENYDREMSRTDPKWSGSREQEELRVHLQELGQRVVSIEGEG
jgi:hypothetical protein